MSSLFDIPLTILDWALEETTARPPSLDLLHWSLYLGGFTCLFRNWRETTDKCCIFLDPRILGQIVDRVSPALKRKR